MPVIACWCYLFDGVYIGLMKAKAMRNSMIIATFACFFPLWWILQSFLSLEMSNHALWADSYQWLDRILVVDVLPEVQLQRLMKRDSISRELAGNMMQSQCSRRQRLALADDVINNEQSLQDLEKHVETLNCLNKQFKSKKNMHFV